MDTTQLLLTTTLTVTTLFLIVVGIQLVFVLREVYRAFKKANAIIEGFENLGSTLTHGFVETLGFVGGVKTLFKAIDLIHKRKHERGKKS